MATGIEAASLALAVLPLLVNQLEAYVRGIEKIKVLRHYRSEFALYSVKLGAQRVMLLDTLEEALKGVVNDNAKVSELLSDPQSQSWHDKCLQDRLRNKLGRSYDPFVGIMTELSELLDRLSERMGIHETGIKQNPPTKARKALRSRLLIWGPIYDDLLTKIDVANTTLRNLTEPSNHRQRTSETRLPWDEFFQKYQMARNHADQLFRGIIEGTYWNCSCKEHHVVHFQLQSNPFQPAEGEISPRNSVRYRMTFSHEENESFMGQWNWREVEWELRDETLPAPLIQDLCSSLSVQITDSERRRAVGYFPHEVDAKVRYALIAVNDSKQRRPQQPLHQALQRMNRRDRIRIAAGLACGVMQLCGNWLKPRWNSSDIRLACDTGEVNVMSDFLFFSWPLHMCGKFDHTSHLLDDSDVRGNMLVPLGRTLVELSLGRTIETSNILHDIQGDENVACVNTAIKLIEGVLHESGSNYADAVRNCLLWSGVSQSYDDKRFQEHVFSAIVSPLLTEMAYFEGIV
ncbi:hypothetical protein BJY00DRAFT_292767 [Aspergillus carlsbadensis]|nr:hypothetical protein BJY00DRAFT_292767 [Aspergillus carlsbadensis]